MTGYTINMNNSVISLISACVGFRLKNLPDMYNTWAIYHKKIVNSCQNVFYSSNKQKINS